MNVIAVVGPTASGKTALALEIAEQMGGEIVNADSRQVYRHMDIGTAKPSADELARVPHHLIDIRDPDEPFGLAEFLDVAGHAIRDITSRGRLPLIAGGTGQYVRALLEGWQAPAVPPDPAFRQALEERAASGEGEALYVELAAADPEAAASIDRRNTRRVIRALEVIRATGRPFSQQRGRSQPPYRVLQIGVAWSRQDLYARIDRRVDEMFAAGLVDEVRALRSMGYACHLPALDSIGYAEVCDYLAGARTLAEAAAHAKTATHRLARTQANWFRRTDPRIHWVDGASGRLVDEAVAAVDAFLRRE